MALFFDAPWFDQRLTALGLSRPQLGQALGLDDQAVRELFKDQRELSAREVAVLAALLAVPAAEIANRAGISTPVPKDPPKDPPHDAHSDAQLLARLEAIERELAEIKALLTARRS